MSLRSVKERKSDEKCLFVKSKNCSPKSADAPAKWLTKNLEKFFTARGLKVEENGGKGVDLVSSSHGGDARVSAWVQLGLRRLLGGLEACLEVEGNVRIKSCRSPSSNVKMNNEQLQLSRSRVQYQFPGEQRTYGACLTTSLSSLSSLVHLCKTYAYSCPKSLYISGLLTIRYPSQSPGERGRLKACLTTSLLLSSYLSQSCYFCNYTSHKFLLLKSSLILKFPSQSIGEQRRSKACLTTAFTEKTISIYCEQKPLRNPNRQVNKYSFSSSPANHFALNPSLVHLIQQCGDVHPNPGPRDLGTKV